MNRMVLVMSMLLSFSAMLNAEFKEITSVEAVAIMKSDRDIVVLDVRTKEEFKVGHVKGAVNIDMRKGDALRKIDKLDRNATYIVYCRTKNRSKTAVDHMRESGFVNVYHMMDGFVGWEKNGLPIEK